MVIGAVLIALFSAEAVARALPDQEPQAVTAEPDDSLWAPDDWRSPPDHAYQSDPMLGYVHAASAVADVKVAEHPDRAFRFRTNSYGLRRDSELAVPKPPGVFRVLVLGDSQTSGYTHNDETYPSQLEAIWRERAGGRPVEVANAGIDGYGPQQAYLWYLEYGVPLGADLVILAVYAGNDLDDLAHGAVDGIVIEDGAGLIGPVQTPLKWLSLRSEFVRTVRPPLRHLLDGANGERSLVPRDPLVRLMRECHGCWLQSLKQAVRARIAPDDAARAVRRLELGIGLINSVAASEGSKFVVLPIPTKSHVEPDDEPGAVGRATRLLELTPEDTAYDAVAYDRIREAARRAQVPVIDPLADLQQQDQARRLYYRRDWHLNPHGNRVLAEAIHRALGQTLGFAN